MAVDRWWLVGVSWLVFLTCMNQHQIGACLRFESREDRTASTKIKSRLNVLFLVIDDLRPQLNCYLDDDFPSPVHPNMHTPNIDQLAGQSFLLRRAHVQQAWCGPSRTSFLTGRRPDTTHVYDLTHYWRKVGGNFTTLPQYFKEHGYNTIGAGKIFHPGKQSGKDDPISWSTKFKHSHNSYKTKKSWFVVPTEDRKKKPLQDDLNTAYIIKQMQELAPGARNGDQPFFLALGLHKPHLPFMFPEEFLSYYPESSIRFPPNAYAPQGMPDVAWNNWWKQLKRFSDIRNLNLTGAINETMPDDFTLALRRAYYSATSYADSLIGRVMNELKKLGLENSTVVSLVGDHGWQLGEHDEWCKQTNFELSTHAPMMIKIPGVTEDGIVTKKLAEFVDLFPTLVDAAGLPAIPLCPEASANITICTEGSSLYPLMLDPSADWKTAAFSQYPRSGNIMGYTARTDKYRYTEWVAFDYAPKYAPNWDSVSGVELYDHTKDPEENVNRANDPQYGGLRQELSEMLHAGWRAALPPGQLPSPNPDILPSVEQITQRYVDNSGIQL